MHGDRVLEYHHRHPFAAGGKATVENIELRCRAHNAYEAQLFFSCDVVRERDEDSFWNERRPLRGHESDRLREAVSLYRSMQSEMSV